MVHKGILSLTINIVVNTTFRTVMASLADSVVSPVLNVFNNIGFSRFRIAVGNTAVVCNGFVATMVGFLVVTFMVFLVMGLIGGIVSLNGGARSRRTPAAGGYPFYFDSVSVGTAGYPRYATSVVSLARGASSGGWCHYCVGECCAAWRPAGGPR